MLVSKEETMREQVQRFLVLHFGAQAVQLIKFLDRGFTPSGWETISSLFAAAALMRIPLDTILEVAERTWNSTWRDQPEEVRGDVDAHAPWGGQSVLALEIIYRELGIPSPAPALA